MRGAAGLRAHRLCGLQEVTSLTLSFPICDNRPHLVGFLEGSSRVLQWGTLSVVPGVKDAHSQTLVRVVRTEWNQ